MVILFTLTLENSTEKLEELIRKLVERLNKIRKNYSRLILQIREQKLINDSSLSLYEKKLEEFRTGSTDENWGLLIELKNLAKEEVNKETSLQWFLIFKELFHLLTNEEAKRISLGAGEINHEEWEQIQKSNHQAREKIHQNCRKIKKRKIEEHIQKLAANYLKKYPNSLYSREALITDILWRDWRTEINENRISNIENEKRDYEALFVNRSDRFQRSRLMSALFLIGFVCTFFYPYTKIHRKYKVLFSAKINDLSEKQKEKRKEIYYIVSKRFFIMISVLVFFAIFSDLIQQKVIEKNC